MTEKNDSRSSEHFSPLVKHFDRDNDGEPRWFFLSPGRFTSKKGYLPYAFSHLLSIDLVETLCYAA
jgi:hypothetical protein